MSLQARFIPDRRTALENIRRSSPLLDWPVVILTTLICLAVGVCRSLIGIPAGVRLIKQLRAEADERKDRILRPDRYRLK